MNNLGAGLKTQDWGKFIQQQTCLFGSSNTNFGFT